MILKYLVLALALFNSSTSFGQNTLVFYKNKYRQAYYTVGDIISFNTREEKSKISGQIRAIKNDSVITFRDFEVNIKDVTYLYVDNKTRLWFVFRYKYKYVLPIAGIGYALIALVNEGTLTSNALTTSGSLVSAGILANIFISEKMKVRGKRKLFIISK